ncbi:dihydroxyacetone kinase transcriptional activator DhaS [Clostridium sp. DSM 100503]|uniref:dihydroxyacetone kinase transcriptional activator DhaS n=1 Tax=Clostridium sp. DSM 100503 TaxID=2963282 RepID=UPI002149ED6B|nr:dihydroxyacetone kinase transcriptional activator DhaS [Clostridium sp. DSM 100503]MCR1952784.1 dihydroxyacetone kinase transcriptional activator DhaS [Clostridium sp. DSM 100503]
MSSSLQTKKSLAKSLKKLMKVNPLHKISVKDIVKDCNVNRQTFYYHFHDIYELVEWIYKTEAIESIEEYKSYSTWIDGFYKIFLYIEDNKEFCYNTLNSLSRTHLDMYLFSVINDLLMGVINEVSSDMSVKSKDKKFMADFYTHAFEGLVIQWMKDGMKEDPKVLIEKLKELIEGNFVRALKRYEEMV